MLFHGALSGMNIQTKINMARMPIPLGVGSYESVSRPFSVQRCVNMYADAAQAEALNDFMLYGTPGIVSFSTVGASASRGAHVMNGVYYVVSGTSLYSIDSLGVVSSSLGTVAGTARVKFADNGDKLVILVPGGNAYVYIASAPSFAQITSVNFRTSDSVCFKDGYYIFTETGTNVFFNSALNDPLTFGALDFGTAELAPGPIISCHVNFDELFIIKSDMLEIFQNVGGSGFPFQRVQGASMEKGTHSKYSPVEWEDDFYFLGGGRNEKTAVFRTGTTTTPEKISTDAIDNEIQKFTQAEVAQSFSFTYAIGGFSFVGFTIRSVNINSRTFVFNVTASRLMQRPIWFEQQTGITENAWRPQSVTLVYDKLLVSDVTDGRIGYLDEGTYTDYSAVISREKTLPPLSAGGVATYLHALELTVDAGQGLISGQGSDPVIMLDYSDDGGRTWSSELKRPLGDIGEYFRRVEWRRLGRIPSHRVFRFRQTDPIKTAWIKLEGDLTGGR